MTTQKTFSPSDPPEVDRRIDLPIGLPVTSPIDPTGESPVVTISRILWREIGIAPSNRLVMMLIDAVRRTTPPPREVTIGMLEKILRSLQPSLALNDWAARSAKEVVRILSEHPRVREIAHVVDDEAIWCVLEGTIAGMLLRVCEGKGLEGEKG